MLSSIWLSGWRNINEIQLTELKQINVFHGSNGAGKTSILESLYYAGTGRSFRESDSRKIIQHGQSEALMRLELENRDGRRLHLKLRKNRKEQQFYLEQDLIQKRSELIKLFPVVDFTPSSQKLVEDGPGYRRKYLDQVLFHVKHDYIAEYQAYNQLLKQRNAILQQQSIEPRLLNVVSEQLAAAGHRLHESRQELVKALSPVVSLVMQDHFDWEAVSLQLRSGWKAGQDLLSALNEKLVLDQRQGYTSVGPHRADLMVLSEDRRLEDTLSRGQQKVLIFALQMAKNQLLRQHDVNALLLVDELCAELDSKRIGRLSEYLYASGQQVFISTVEKDCVQYFPKQDVSMFHVEHGQVLLTDSVDYE